MSFLKDFQLIIYVFDDYALSRFGPGLGAKGILKLLF